MCAADAPFFTLETMTFDHGSVYCNYLLVEVEVQRLIGMQQHAGPHLETDQSAWKTSPGDDNDEQMATISLHLAPRSRRSHVLSGDKYCG
jgi:hypothetical protein